MKCVCKVIEQNKRKKNEISNTLYSRLSNPFLDYPMLFVIPVCRREEEYSYMR